MNKISDIIPAISLTLNINSKLTELPAYSIFRRVIYRLTWPGSSALGRVNISEAHAPFHRQA